MRPLALALLLAGCTEEAPPSSEPLEDPPVAETEAELDTEAETETREEVAEVTAGAYVWDGGPFPELTHAEALAHCAERGRALLGQNQMLAELTRHREALGTNGVFWSAGVSQLEPSEAEAVELRLVGGGPIRMAVSTHPRSERLRVRCVRPNPNPPPAEEGLGSCDTIDSDSKCMQHDAEAFATLSADSRAGLCASFGGGTYRREACPTEGLVGRCTVGGGQLEHYYDRGGRPFDPESADARCRGEFETVD